MWVLRLTDRPLHILHKNWCPTNIFESHCQYSKYRFLLHLWYNRSKYLLEIPLYAMITLHLLQTPQPASTIHTKWTVQIYLLAAAMKSLCSLNVISGSGNDLYMKWKYKVQVPYIRIFLHWEILAKMTLERCVKFSLSPNFSITRNQWGRIAGFIFSCVYSWRFQGGRELSEN